MDSNRFCTSTLRPQETRLADSRISPIDPTAAAPRIKAVLDAQSKQWGAPLNNHLLYARVPELFKGVRGMWSAVAAAGGLDPTLVALLNRRVASLNQCPF